MLFLLCCCGWSVGNQWSSVFSGVGGVGAARGPPGQGHEGQGVREHSVLCPPPPGNHRSLHQKLGQVAGKGIVKPIGDIPESETLRREAHDLFAAFSGHRAGATLLALASWYLEGPQLWERTLMLPPFSTFRGAGPLFLGSEFIW